MKEEKEVQLAFSETARILKLYMITMTEQERLYGLKLLEVLRSEFKEIDLNQIIQKYTGLCMSFLMTEY